MPKTPNELLDQLNLLVDQQMYDPSDDLRKVLPLLAIGGHRTAKTVDTILRAKAQQSASNIDRNQLRASILDRLIDNDLQQQRFNLEKERTELLNTISRSEEERSKAKESREVESFGIEKERLKTKEGLEREKFELDKKGTLTQMSADAATRFATIADLTSNFIPRFKEQVTKAKKEGLDTQKSKIELEQLIMERGLAKKYLDARKSGNEAEMIKAAQDYAVIARGVEIEPQPNQYQQGLDQLLGSVGSYGSDKQLLPQAQAAREFLQESQTRLTPMNTFLEALQGQQQSPQISQTPQSPFSPSGEEFFRRTRPYGNPGLR